MKRLTAIFYGVTRAHIESRTRLNRRHCWPRQVAMALSYRYARLSLPQVGALFGRDHTTVLHAIRVVERKSRENAVHARDLTMLCAQIEGGTISISSAWAQEFDRRLRRDRTARERTLAEIDRYSAALMAANANFSLAASSSVSPVIAAILPGLRVLRLRGPGSFAEAA